MYRFLARVLIGIAAYVCMVRAQNVDGQWDTGFAGDGRELVDVSFDADDFGQVLRIQPDGKLLMAGTCTRFAGPIAYDKFCLTRLRPDGAYDTASNADPGFGPAGLGYLSFDHFAAQGFPQESSLNAMALRSDGRIVLLGSTTDVGILMASLTADGTALDPAVANGYILFEAGTPFSGGYALAVQTDGKILVAGRAIGLTDNEDMAVWRFLPDFRPDTAFGTNGRQTVTFDVGGPSGSHSDTAVAVAVQTDGRIVLAGDAGIEVAVARLLPNGQSDTSFGTDHNGRVHFPPDATHIGTANAIRVDRQGRLVIVGAAVSAIDARCLADRLLADGTQDPNFNRADGAGHPQIFTMPTGGCFLNDVALQTDGAILTVGSAYRNANTARTYFAAIRFTPNGQFDASFGIGGKSYGGYSPSADIDDSGAAAAIGSGGLMIAGRSTNLAVTDTRFGIARLTLDKIFVDEFEN